MQNTRKICYIISEATSAFYDLGVLHGEIKYLSAIDWEIIVICGSKTKIDKSKIPNNCRIMYTLLKREPSLFLDLIALFQVINIIFIEKPSIVCYTMPKGALIGAIASWLVRIPTRIYLLTAAKFETSFGLKRQILIFLEKITINTSTNVLCVSDSLRKLFYENNVPKHPNMISVIDKGSASGVDFEYYNSDFISEESQASKKSELGILDSDIVLGFVGRINKDKGVEDLIDSILELKKKNDNYNHLKLLIVGKFDTNDFIDEKYFQAINTLNWIKHISYIKEIRLIYKCMDIFILPTHREGFPGVILEAYAMKIPIITTNATGAVDSVINEVTGLVFSVSNLNELSICIEDLALNKSRRNLLAENGYQWARKHFEKNTMIAKIIDFYLNSKNYE
jgi:glycosyltransferase involved in cell wall biosynthesis